MSTLLTKLGSSLISVGLLAGCSTKAPSIVDSPYFSEMVTTFPSKEDSQFLLVEKPSETWKAFYPSLEYSVLGFKVGLTVSNPKLDVVDSEAPPFSIEHQCDKKPQVVYKKTKYNNTNGILLYESYDGKNISLGKNGEEVRPHAFMEIFYFDERNHSERLYLDFDRDGVWDLEAELFIIEQLPLSECRILHNLQALPSFFLKMAIDNGFSNAHLLKQAFKECYRHVYGVSCFPVDPKDLPKQKSN